MATFSASPAFRQTIEIYLSSNVASAGGCHGNIFIVKYIIMMWSELYEVKPAIFTLLLQGALASYFLSRLELFLSNFR